MSAALLFFLVRRGLEHFVSPAAAPVSEADTKRGVQGVDADTRNPEINKGCT